MLQAMKYPVYISIYLFICNHASAVSPIIPSNFVRFSAGVLNCRLSAFFSQCIVTGSSSHTRLALLTCSITCCWDDSGTQSQVIWKLMVHSDFMLAPRKDLCAIGMSVPKPLVTKSSNGNRCWWVMTHPESLWTSHSFTALTSKYPKARVILYLYLVIVMYIQIESRMNFLNRLVGSRRWCEDWVPWESFWDVEIYVDPTLRMCCTSAPCDVPEWRNHRMARR